MSCPCLDQALLLCALNHALDAGETLGKACCLQMQGLPVLKLGHHEVAVTSKEGLHLDPFAFRTEDSFPTRTVSTPYLHIMGRLQTTQRYTSQVKRKPQESPFNPVAGIKPKGA